MIHNTFSKNRNKWWNLNDNLPVTICLTNWIIYTTFFPLHISFWISQCNDNRNKLAFHRICTLAHKHMRSHSNQSIGKKCQSGKKRNWNTSRSFARNLRHFACVFKLAACYSLRIIQLKTKNRQRREMKITPSHTHTHAQTLILQSVHLIWIVPLYFSDACVCACVSSFLIGVSAAHVHIPLMCKNLVGTPSIGSAMANFQRNFSLFALKSHHGTHFVMLKLEKKRRNYI